MKEGLIKGPRAPLREVVDVDAQEALIIQELADPIARPLDGVDVVIKREIDVYRRGASERVARRELRAMNRSRGLAWPAASMLHDVDLTTMRPTDLIEVLP